jgi:hypothetical protein
MDEATIAVTVMSGLFAAIFLGFLIWGILNRQFSNVEEASRHMIRNNVQTQKSPVSPEKANTKLKSKGVIKDDFRSSG